MNDSQEKKPECIGFIMDGNRRWARAKGLSTAEGHAKGYAAMKELVSIAYKKGISHIVCYAFSTENWGRSEEEVGYLMNLLKEGLDEIKKDFSEDERRVNFRVVGEREKLPENLQRSIEKLEENSHEEPELTVWVALSYGGRTEILEAVNQAVRRGEEVNEKTFRKFMWTSDMPDPDLIIRTSGEQRLSNFLLWQAAYSELMFTDTLWPDFGEKELESMLEEYAGRQRRRGE